MRSAKISTSNNAPAWEGWLAALALVGFGLAWEALARSGRISALFFPPPSRILADLWALAAGGKLWPHLRVSLERLGLGFSLGGLAGWLLGLGMGWSPRLRALVDPFVAALHPIPKIAIFPLLMMIFGLGETPKVIAIAIAAFFPMLINSMAGVRGLNPVYFEVARSYGAGRWLTFRRVALPGSLPLTLAGVRLALNMALVVGVAVELLSAKEGLGVLIWFAWQTLRIEDLYASLVVIGGLGLGLNLLLHALSRRLAPWHAAQEVDV